MITRKKIIDKAAQALGVQNDPDEILRLQNLLNDIVSAASELHSFQLLRRKMEVDLASSDTTEGSLGTWLPANLAGIDAVQDKDTGIFLAPRDYSEIANVEQGRPRYTAYSPGTQPLFWCDDVRIDKGANTFTSILLDNNGTDYTGEWVQIGADSQTYLLTGPREIATRYWGESITDGVAQIRPPTQRKLIVHDDHDTQLVRGTVIVYYWIYHPMLYRDNDLLLFPNSRWIDLTLLKEARGVLGRRSRDPINVDIDRAWKDLVRLNPSFSAPIGAVDRIGNMFDNAATNYVRRGGPMDKAYDIQTAILIRRNDT